MSNDKSAVEKQAFQYLLSYALNGVPLIKQLILIRKLIGKSQAQVSKDMKVCPSAVCIIESGKRGTSMRLFLAYCESLGLKIVLVPKERVKSLK